MKCEFNSLIMDLLSKLFELILNYAHNNNNNDFSCNKSIYKISEILIS